MRARVTTSVIPFTMLMRQCLKELNLPKEEREAGYGIKHHVL